jgi:hypothetical protein
MAAFQQKLPAVPALLGVFFACGRPLSSTAASGPYLALVIMALVRPRADLESATHWITLTRRGNAGWTVAADAAVCGIFGAELGC